MNDFIMSLTAWAILCLCSFLALSGLLSFYELEWRWAGESGYERGVLGLLWLFFVTKVKWGAA
jgi:nitric oxide reductase large subunit